MIKLIKEDILILISFRRDDSLKNIKREDGTVLTEEEI